MRICLGDGHSTIGVWTGTAPVCAGWQCTMNCIVAQRYRVMILYTHSLIFDVVLLRLLPMNLLCVFIVTCGSL